MAFTVFGLTGSTSVAVVRPLFHSVGFEGSMREGPWSYRIGSLLAVSPVYACMLVSFGTLAGRHRFFAGMAQKIVGRMVPRSLLSRLTCKGAAPTAALKESATKGATAAAAAAKAAR